MRKKRVGIVAVDRGGSRANFPYVIASIYSDKVSNFEHAVKEVREKLKMRHGYIKGKDFKPSQYQKVIQIIKGSGIDFFVYLVPQKVYDKIKNEIKWKRSWEAILESYLWYKSVKLLTESLKQSPSEVIYETTYTDDNATIFDSFIRIFLNKKLDINKDNVTAGSKTSCYIMIADWIAHFIHKDGKLYKHLKNKLRFCEVKIALEDLKLMKIKNSPSSRIAPGTTGIPMNDLDNNMMLSSIFKAFGYCCFASKEFIWLFTKVVGK